MEEIQVLEKVLIVMLNNEPSEELFSYRLSEINNLVVASNYEIVDTIIQNKSSVDKRTYVGKGKLDEIKQEIVALEENGTIIENVIFESELSPIQIKNIEDYLDKVIIDRTMLILDIFERRAKTKEAYLQVKIAKLKYMLPRLVGSRNYLSRTGGGGGGASGARRGSGETKLELDHRHIENQILKAKAELDEIVKNRKENRKLRSSNGIKVVSLVGYTNAGKSSTINYILNNYHTVKTDGIDKQVFVKNMLFATLETATRRVKLENNHEFLITDTIGFVSNLPHHLVESFKSTLEEIKDSDLIIHIIDAGSPYMDLQIDTTLKVLTDLNVTNIPIINVYNKVDLVTDYFIGKIDKNDSVCISSKTGRGYDELIHLIDEKLYDSLHDVTFLIPYDKGEIVNNLMEVANVKKVDYLENGTLVDVVVSDYIYNLYKNYLTHEWLKNAKKLILAFFLFIFLKFHHNVDT